MLSKLYLPKFIHSQCIVHSLIIFALTDFFHFNFQRFSLLDQCFWLLPFHCHLFQAFIHFIIPICRGFLCCVYLSIPSFPLFLSIFLLAYMYIQTTNIFKKNFILPISPVNFSLFLHFLFYSNGRKLTTKLKAFITYRICASLESKKRI